MSAQPTLLRTLLIERHLQRYETFRVEYERAASGLAPELTRTAPSRAQYFRWLTGQLKGGVAHPDACRVLEGMFPPWTASQLLGPSPPADSLRLDSMASIESSKLLTDVPPGFPAEALTGAWLTGYEFSDPPRRHVDVAHLTALGDQHVQAMNFPPEPRTEGHPTPFRNQVEARLAGRHLLGAWRNTSDARYFGGLHLAALPGENVLAGYYTGVANDVEVSRGRWTWIRLDPDSLQGVDLEAACLREPAALAELLAAHARPYSPPLPLTAVLED